MSEAAAVLGDSSPTVYLTKLEYGSGDQRFALAAQQAKEMFHAHNQDP